MRAGGFELPNRYGYTNAGWMFRIAERFGQDPFRIMREWTPGEQLLASDNEILRQAEEVREAEQGL